MELPPPRGTAVRDELADEPPPPEERLAEADPLDRGRADRCCAGSESASPNTSSATSAARMEMTDRPAGRRGRVLRSMVWMCGFIKLSEGGATARPLVLSTMVPLGIDTARRDQLCDPTRISRSSLRALSRVDRQAAGGRSSDKHLSIQASQRLDNCRVTLRRSKHRCPRCRLERSRESTQ